MLSVDVVCPVYGKPFEIERLLNDLEKQEDIIINNVVCPFTLCDELCVNEEIRECLIKHKTIFFELSQKKFSHSATREEAIRNYCTSNIVILLSQDVILFDKKAISILAGALTKDVVYAYGKQICNNNSIEKYIREKNYGNTSITIDKSHIEKMQLMAFFSSDAFSALDRRVFLALNGYQGYDVMMNEDQLYSKIVLDNGFKKMYVADAVVEHSHKYSFKQLYDRYYQTGKFYKDTEIFDKYKTTNSGLSLALYVLKQAIKHFDIPVLLRWLPDMSSRYLGMKRGKRK